MTSLPEKLIAVGMRFRPAEARKLVTHKLTGESVMLVRDCNANGVRDPDGLGPYAYAVVFQNQIIAYVRNKDISSIFDSTTYLNNPMVTLVYKVAAVHENYLVLKLERGIASTGTTNILATNGPTITSTYGTTSFESAVSSAAHTIDATRYAFSALNDKIKLTENQKESKMNTSNMRDSFFREVKNVVIDIQSGKLGVSSKDGIATFTNGQVNVNPITDFGVKVPAFAMRVEVTNLAEGDIIVNGDESTFFKSKTEAGYEVVTLSGEVRQVGSVSNMFFGKNTVLAVKNMFGEGTNPMMMALLMGDGFAGDNKNMLLAMAMSGGFGNAEGMGGMNPMMLALLMSK